MQTENNLNNENLRRGPIAWMAVHSVVPNLLMLALIIGGILGAFRVRKEIFPEFSMDMVSISVIYPGASPEEVERGVILAIEESVRGLTGVKEVSSNASEGSAKVTVEMARGANQQKLLSDIQNEVDRITSFPAEAERPVISLLETKSGVADIVIYGNVNDHDLKKLAEKVREDLLAKRDITQVEIRGLRNPEISVEIEPDRLEEFNLTPASVADRIRAASVEMPGGALKARGGEILVRTDERRDMASEFLDVPIVTGSDGVKVRLGDIAEIKEDFEDSSLEYSYNGVPAALVKIYRTGDQSVLQVADAIFEYIDEYSEAMPAGVKMAIWNDMSDLYRQRINVLMKNAFFGLLLVIVLLGLFLELRLAFWVTLGIPISFLGGAMLMPAMDVSVNMISLFAFIVALGIVVDDAIIVGENIHEMRSRGMNALDAAIKGAQQMAVPVIFSVLTNIAAFMPLFFLPGMMGKIAWNIPAIIITVFAFSLLESLFILPAHLAHQSNAEGAGLISRFDRFQESFTDNLERLLSRIYKPVLMVALKYRYVTSAVGIVMLLISGAYIRSGRIEFRMFPQLESDVVYVSIRLPFGSTEEETNKVRNAYVDMAEGIIEENGGSSIVKGILAATGSDRAGMELPVSAGKVNLDGSHLASVTVYLVSSDKRNISAQKFVELWREASEKSSASVGLESLAFSYEGGPQAGAPVDMELSHKDMDTLYLAASDAASSLSGFEGIINLDKGYSPGKYQIDVTMRPQGQRLGLSAAATGKQIRDYFWGAEALRFQRNRDEIKVMVRLPERFRDSLDSLNRLRIMTPTGSRVDAAAVAELNPGRSYTVIRRVDGRRVVNVTTDVMRGSVSPSLILKHLQDKVIPSLKKRYIGLGADFGGEKQEMAESMGDSLAFFAMIMVTIYVLLAIPFDSYTQPVLVMSAIPFGLVGALIGHILMGFGFSMISMMGLIALAGVVVNDSLVLIDTANKIRGDGMEAEAAIIMAGIRRMRPILLTSLTTFLGLMPMIFETSMQARMMIPMAISLGFGILFCTGVTLLLIPCFYMILEAIRGPKS